jgi:acyl carrier protein
MKKIEICRIVEDCLKLKKNSINENTKSSDVEEWDSLGQISIVMFLDKKYNDITKDNPSYMTASSIVDFYEAGLKNVDYIE